MTPLLNQACSEVEEEKILLGRVSAAYGIKGWVRIYSFTDPVEQIFTYKPWILTRQGNSQTKKVCQGRVQGKGIVAQFEGCESRNQAEDLIGYEIWVDENTLPELMEGEYYWYQLEGLEVMNLAGEQLGKIDYLMNVGARDVMVIRQEADMKSGQSSLNTKGEKEKEHLIPFVNKEIVKKVDLDLGQILVDWAKDWG